MADRDSTNKRSKKVFKVAARLLSTKGYDKTSLSDIAQATGLTKAGLYYYVQSKEELLYMILNSYMDKLIDGIKKIKENFSDPIEFIHECIRFQINIYKTDPYGSKLIIHDENCLSGTFFKVIKGKQREYIRFWKQGIINICDTYSIELDYPSVYTHMLVGICNWIYQWYNIKGEVKPEELSEKIFKIFFRGLMSFSKKEGDNTN